VVMRRVETGERHVGEVPLEMFQGSRFKEKDYLDRALEIVQDGIKALKVGMDEPLHICRGYILSRAREVLEASGYNVVRSKIEGHTQELAESEFIESLVRLGVGEKEEVVGMRSFSAFLGWVHEDIDTRESFVKTGWRAWPRLRGDRG
jgi:methionine synthase II (cobalamin-independent)